MMHKRTGKNRILFCKQCRRKTKHNEWNHEVVYQKKKWFGLIKKFEYKLMRCYTCPKCDKSILWRKCF